MKRLRNQRGVALLLVLWACTVLAILLGGYATLARTAALQSRTQLAQARAHYAAEAGLAWAIDQLQGSAVGQRMAADGRAYPFRFDGIDVQVSVVGEDGKVDLNAATPEVLQGLFRAAGEDAVAARQLAVEVVDWRSFATRPGQSAQARARYAAVGRDYGPRQTAFASLAELQLVLGMTPALYRQIEPAITIWSGRSAPDPNSAPPLALAAIPGLGSRGAQAVQLARGQRTGASATASGATYSIHASAMVADGARAAIHATLRLRDGAPGTPPYVVLRWQEGGES